MVVVSARFFIDFTLNVRTLFSIHGSETRCQLIPSRMQPQHQSAPLRVATIGSLNAATPPSPAEPACLKRIFGYRHPTHPTADIAAQRARGIAKMIASTNTAESIRVPPHPPRVFSASDSQATCPLGRPLPRPRGCVEGVVHWHNIGVQE